MWLYLRASTSSSTPICQTCQKFRSPYGWQLQRMSTQATVTVAPTLPWYRDRADIPGPLPTQEHIEAATTEFPSLYSANHRRTVLVNDFFVVKYGPLVSENEGHALLLVESFPDIRAPLLYAMYREGRVLYIVMEFIPGQQLSNVWPSLSEDSKSSIVDQLRLACDTIRSIPSPGYYGGALGGPLPHRFFFSLTKDPRVTGPFSDERDLGHALAIHSAKNWEESGRHNWLADFFARHVPTSLRGYDIVFTHTDFQRKNILVQEEECFAVDGSIAPKKIKVTAILDWESAGWFPSYWGYASCFVYFSWSDDWPEKVERMLDPYVKEAALLRIIAQDLD